MESVIINQRKEYAVSAAAAFRQAYSTTKLIKSALWSITFLLAILQLSVATIDKLKIDLTVTAISILCIYVLLGSFGKIAMMNHQILGCNIQRLHDYLVLQVCQKPNEFELPPSKIKKLAKKWFKKDAESKKRELETWWDKSLSRVSFSQARLICCYSTFSWEIELRNKYQYLLSIILTVSVLLPLSVSCFLKFNIYETLLLTIAPFTPFISLVLEEWLMNKSCLKEAEKINRNVQDVWSKVTSNSITDKKLMKETNDLMETWQTYRLTTLPIFEWLYRISRAQMEDDMIVNTESLVNQLQVVQPCAAMAR